MLGIKYYLVLGMILIIYSACTNDQLEPEIVDPIIETISYDSTIKNIMVANCTACHSGTNPIAGVGLDSYEDVRFYTEQQDLVFRIMDISDPMPPSGLMTAQEILLIEKWIQDGFLEN